MAMLLILVCKHCRSHRLNKHMAKIPKIWWMMGLRHKLELIYHYLPPSFHLTVVVSVLSLLIQHFQQVLWVLKLLLSPGLGSWQFFHRCQNMIFKSIEAQGSWVQSRLRRMDFFSTHGSEIHILGSLKSLKPEKGLFQNLIRGILVN